MVINLHPHQVRVVVEKQELDERLGRLETFIATDAFEGLAQDEKDRLRLQLTYMRGYSEVLRRRIVAFSGS